MQRKMSRYVATLQTKCRKNGGEGHSTSQEVQLKLRLFSTVRVLQLRLKVTSKQYEINLSPVQVIHV